MPQLDQFSIWDVSHRGWLSMRGIGTFAAIGSPTAVIALLTGLPLASADELADQELLQRRIDQLAQAGIPRQKICPGVGHRTGTRSGDHRRQLPALVSDPGHQDLDPCPSRAGTRPRTSSSTRSSATVQTAATSEQNELDACVR